MSRAFKILRRLRTAWRFDDVKLSVGERKVVTVGLGSASRK